MGTLWKRTGIQRVFVVSLLWIQGSSAFRAATWRPPSAPSAARHWEPSRRVGAERGARPALAPALVPLDLAADIQASLSGPALSFEAFDPDWTRYAFMFPVAVVVATLAQTAGIGGAALFAPIFVLVFPLLGPSFPLGSLAAAVACAIATEAFGFSSGLLGYARRGLVDTRLALPFMAASVPFCLLGANLVPYANETALKGVYAVVMLGLSAFLLREERPVPELEGDEPESCEIDDSLEGETRVRCAPDGVEFRYKTPDFGLGTAALTAFGGLLMGLLGVGVGEVVVPNLVKKNAIPLPVSAGTSVLIVLVNAVVAAATQVNGLVAAGGFDLLPLNLVAFTIPGVVIGGQLAPRVQGLGLPPRGVEVCMAYLFGAIGLSFGYTSVQALAAAAQHSLQAVS